MVDLPSALSGFEGTRGSDFLLCCTGMDMQRGFPSVESRVSADTRDRTSARD